jgi:serine/threonine protein kinase
VARLRTPSTALRSGATVGPFTLVSGLGRGGNAEVWKARRGAEAPVALKVLTDFDPRSETFARFRQEVRALQHVGAFDGVLPLLDAHLPAEPSLHNRPWLSLPVATPIATALRGASLQRKVAAAAAIADTLERLYAAHGIAHRDIKPGNLYVYNDSFVIGDFGLVSLPEGADITRPNRPVGPRNYMAYEMLTDPVGADAHLGDVYALAKTLWVLVTEQHYPPLGHIRADTPGLRVSDVYPFLPAARTLDTIIDHATRDHVERRTPMDLLVRELVALRDREDDYVMPEDHDIAAALRATFRQAMEEEDTDRARLQAAIDAARTLNERLGPVNERIAAITTTARFGAPSAFANGLIPPGTMGNPAPVWSARSTTIVPGDRTSLRIATATALFATGDITFYAGIIVDRGEETLNVHEFLWILEPPLSAPADSTLIENAIERTVRAIEHQVSPALEALYKLRTDT